MTESAQLQGRRYERITAKTEDGKTATYRCLVVSESDHFLTAQVLDKDWTWGGKFDGQGNEIDTRWVVEKALITKRVPMRENPTYGTWEPVE